MIKKNKFLPLIGAFSFLSICLAVFTTPVSSSASPVSAKVSKVSASSISINVTSTSSGKAYIEYSYLKSKYTDKTATASLVKAAPVTFTIDGLKAE